MQKTHFAWRPNLILIEPNFSNDGPRRSKAPSIDLCRQLKALPHSPRVVFHTAHNHPADVAAATLAGADGFIHKSVQEEEFTEAVEDVLSGNPVWLFGVGRKYADKLIRTSMMVARLSSREQEVLHLVLWRYSAEEIASQLRIQPQTIRNYSVSIKKKLGYGSRKELYEDWGV